MQRPCIRKGQWHVKIIKNLKEDQCDWSSVKERKIVKERKMVKKEITKVAESN